MIDKLNADAINSLLTWYKVNKYRLDDQGNTSTLPDVYIASTPLSVRTATLNLE
ncbi:hypothetical protein JCM19231_4723 [Vibrio ishigakensis]|uniref:Uncharacterized protein n=1 Tax=Vibrio ishigakensis TaxID=1481914 RepID=A0A0B8P8I9_9VIBR|nr:hypothetical protein JCM19231_4723 [Vibrio ishigakensis]